MIRTVLFDLDGTLLPMDQGRFVSAYSESLARYMADFGYDPKMLIDSIWRGMGAMVRNDGSQSNEEAFWTVMRAQYGPHVMEDLPRFDDFYRTSFQQIRHVCGWTPLAKETITWAQERGYRIALATNPIFPAVATESRIRWAGLTPDDFELCTTYEMIGYSKPNPAYYHEVMRRLGEEPSNCLMVGNDVADDMAAEHAGASVFLLTDCLINEEGRPIDAYPQGGFQALRAYLEADARKLDEKREIEGCMNR